MNAQPLRALIWKDMRLNRPILILGAGMILFAYLLSLGLEVYAHRAGGPFQGYSRLEAVWETSVPFVVFFAALAAALVGANVVAGEYADRSAAFLAYQPPRRQLVLLSKVISGFVPLLILTIIPLTTLALAKGGLFVENHLWDILSLPSILWLIFTGSWCVGILCRSVAIGVGAGISLPIFLVMALYKFFDDTRDERIIPVFCIAAAVIGTLLFVVATIVLLRRRET